MTKCNVITIYFNFSFRVDLPFKSSSNCTSVITVWALSSHPHRYYTTIKEHGCHHFVFYTLKECSSLCSPLHYFGIRVEVMHFPRNAFTVVFSSLGILMECFAFDLKFYSLRQHTDVAPLFSQLDPSRSLRVMHILHPHYFTQL